MTNSDELHKVIDHYHDLLRQAPNDLGLLINLAWSYERAGQFPEAIQQFRRALEFNTHDYNAHYGLGLACMGNGQIQEARAEFQQARDLAADSDDRSAIVVISRQIDSISHRLGGS
jgi:Flp pilus assembly protein TadD